MCQVTASRLYVQTFGLFFLLHIHVRMYVSVDSDLARSSCYLLPPERVVALQVSS